jgi:hypothetical protein
MMDAEGFEDIIRALLADPATDFGIFCAVPETLMLNIDVNDEKSYIRRIINIYKETKKSMCLSMESGWKYDGFVEHCIDNGIPCFRHSDQAARAVNKLLISKPF